MSGTRVPNGPRVTEFGLALLTALLGVLVWKDKQRYKLMQQMQKGGKAVPVPAGCLRGTGSVVRRAPQQVAAGRHF